MIIFTSKPDIVAFLPWNKPAMIYNMSSLYSGYKDATSLITVPIENYTGLPMQQYVETVDFDSQYANKILSDPLRFTVFMDIIQCDYIGYNAIVLVHREPYRDAFLESLLKFIQQRYGLNAWLIEDVEDIQSLKESQYNPMGIIQLEKDLERYYEFCRSNVILNPVIDINKSVE